MRRMDAAAIHHIDPERVQNERAAIQFEVERLAERARMLVEMLHQLIEHAGALRQIVKRGVGGVTLVAVIFGPALTGPVFGGNGEAGFGERRVQPARGDLRAVERGHEQCLDVTGIGHGARFYALCACRSCGLPHILDKPCGISYTPGQPLFPSCHT